MRALLLVVLSLLLVADGWKRSAGSLIEATPKLAIFGGKGFHREATEPKGRQRKLTENSIESLALLMGNI